MLIFRLPYTRAAVAEIHRFTDLTPTGIGHKTRCDVEFRGFLLPRGTHVLSNLTACHRDPKYWKQPMDFQPENFLDADGQYIENKEGFAPFGVGESSRVCVIHKKLDAAVESNIYRIRTRTPFIMSANTLSF